MKLYLHMREQGVTTLGPGSRYCIWVAGCNRRCPGCIAPESHDMTKGDPIEVNALAWEIIASGAEGITISGGEPFLQAPALAELLRIIRRKKEIGVIVYTGFLLSQLQEDANATALLEQTDLLIDGPYIRELDDGKSLRGSSNQQVYPLTDRYQKDLHLYGADGRQTQTFYHGAYAHHTGIPTNSKYQYQEEYRL